MNVLIQISFLCVLIIGTVYCASESAAEDEEELIESNCLPSNWDIFALVNKLSLSIVPCSINYLRVEYYEDEDKVEDGKSIGKSIYVSGIGILGSFENLTSWTMKEEDIFEIVEDRKTQILKQLELINEYLDDYKSSSKALIGGTISKVETRDHRAKIIAKSGIASYHMTRRFVKTLPKIKELVSEEQSNERRLHDSIRDSELDVWPNHVDIISAVQSLIHIQQIYRWNSDDLPVALAEETNFPPQLNAYHCRLLGLFALEKSQFNMAVFWVEEAIKRVMAGNDTSESISELKDMIEVVANKHNELFRKKEKDRWELNAVFSSEVEPFVFENRSDQDTAGDDYKRQNGIPKHPEFSLLNFHGLCKGNTFQTEIEKSHLMCWYDSLSHEYWRVGPLKKERLSLNPPITQIYDFIGEKDIFDILAASDAQTEKKLRQVERGFRHLQKRTSVNSWVPNEFLPHLQKKIEFLSGLVVAGSSSEPLHIVEYVSGRLYLPHSDSLPSRHHEINDGEGRREIDDRVMTVLLYLNDVESGGSTAFTSVGVAVKPLKGSAIMWENLHRNGTRRMDAWHGACPVVYGHKIVGNKWIRYNPQFQKFKCSLNQFE